MNNALKQVINDAIQPKQTAVIIPIEKITSKRSRKKNISQSKETKVSTPAPLPGFTSPVFKPRKHDLL
jgi:hypothetical protein